MQQEERVFTTVKAIMDAFDESLERKDCEDLLSESERDDLSLSIEKIVLDCIGDTNENYRPIIDLYAYRRT